MYISRKEDRKVVQLRGSISILCVFVLISIHVYVYIHGAIYRVKSQEFTMGRFESPITWNPLIHDNSIL